MEKIINTKIRFILAEEGGRCTIPSGNRYRPHIVVNDSKIYLGVQFIDIPDGVRSGIEYNQKMKLIYEMKEYELLKQGVKFKIMEGSKIVGEGAVL